MIHLEGSSGINGFHVWSCLYLFPRKLHPADKKYRTYNMLCYSISALETSFHWIEKELLLHLNARCKTQAEYAAFPAEFDTECDLLTVDKYERVNPPNRSYCYHRVILLKLFLEGITREMRLLFVIVHSRLHQSLHYNISLFKCIEKCIVNSRLLLWPCLGF